MQVWRRVAFVCVLAWLISVALWSNSTWTETVPLVTPPGAAAEDRTFVCSAPLQPKDADPKDAAASEYPLARQPCEVHGERRVIAVLDLAVGIAGLVLIVYSGARSSVRKDDEDEVAPAGEVDAPADTPTAT